MSENSDKLTNGVKNLNVNDEADLDIDESGMQFSYELILFRSLLVNSKRVSTEFFL